MAFYAAYIALPLLWAADPFVAGFIGIALLSFALKAIIKCLSGQSYVWGFELDDRAAGLVSDPATPAR